MRRSYGARFVCTFVITVIAVCAALVPVSVDAGSAGCPAAPGVNVHRSYAQAAVAPNAIPRALEYLQKAATSSGMSVNDFMLTVGIGVAGTTGVNIFQQGAYYGDQATSTLNKLVTTAEWPSWSELSEAQQESWGSSDNYHAAQFNSALGAVGLAESRNTYYASGGDFDEGTESLLSRIGAIGNKWAGGAIIAASDIYSIWNNPASITYDGTEGQFGIQYNYVVTIDDVEVIFRESNVNYSVRWSGDDYITVTPNTWIVCDPNYQNAYYSFRTTYGTTPLGPVHLTKKEYNGWFWSIDKIGNLSTGSTGFIYKTETQLKGGVSSGSFNFGARPPKFLNKNYVYGYQFGSTTVDFDGMNPDQVIPDTPAGTTDGDTRPEGIGSDKLEPGTTYPDITGTPTEDDTPPYVPPTPDERPDNPYNPPNNENPGYQSGTPEWKNETSENMLPLMNIQFDKLFPFSMLYDIPKLANKVRTVTGTQINDGVYNRVNIPIWNPVNQSDMLVLELNDLYALLVMIRPFMQILLAAFLLFTAIAFWRNILTG